MMKSTTAIIVAGALLPAVVLACVVLIQNGTLSRPNGAATLSAPAPAGVAPSTWRKALTPAANELTAVTSDENNAVLYGWIGVIVALAVGAGVAITRLRERQPPADRTPEPDGRTRDRGGDRGGDRAILIEACIDVSDTVPSDQHREELIEALAKVGVRPVSVRNGELFDPSVHRAAGKVPTSDSGRHNHIAKMQRVGFSDHGRRIRYPSVLVYDGANNRRER